jgi:hypothetical protein
MHRLGRLIETSRGRRPWTLGSPDTKSARLFRYRQLARAIHETP